MTAFQPRSLFTIAASLLAFAATVGCGDDSAVSSKTSSDGPQEPLSPQTCGKDLDALQMLHVKHVSCDVTNDCPTGSHCSEHVCAWDCYADSDCGEGHCTCDGTCRAGKAYSSTTSAGCSAIPEQERTATLLALNAKQLGCVDDMGCPCGSYCDDSQTCHVECIAGTTDPNYTCEDGKSCNELGKCVSATAPADTPKIPLSISFSSPALLADTRTSVKVVSVAVTLESPTVALLAPENTPTVWIGINELEEPGAGSAPHPRVRCSNAGAFADECTFDKAWTLDPVDGKLRSQPRTLFVEFPQSAVKREWTLVARSQLADASTSVALLTEPGSDAPATEPGAYRGTATIGVAPNAVALPVELYVTASDIAIYDATRALFPEGSMVYQRAGADTTFTWLGADAGASGDLIARLHPTSTQFTTSQKRVVSTFTLRLPNSDVAVSIDATQTGPLPVACGSGCGVGSYCQPEMNACLPGVAPQRQLVPTTSTSTSVLESGRLTTWEQTLSSVVRNNIRLVGHDVAQVERAMCYRSDAQLEPGRFGLTTGAPSRELLCSDGAPQSAFELVNTTKAVQVDQQHNITYNLLEHCLDDLAVKPSANVSALATCASLPRIFSALRYDAELDSQAGTRAYAGVLRLWLQLHAFVARTGLQQREYDDALNSGGSSSARLEQLLTTVNDGWRILLDHRVLSMLRPFWDRARTDYRDVARPVHRWSFAAMHTGSFVVPDREGTNGLRVTNFDIGTSTNDQLVLANNQNATCETEQPIDIGTGGFSLGALVSSSWVGTRILASKNGGGSAFAIRLTHNKKTDTFMDVDLTSGIGYPVRFHVPFESGYYVVTAQQNGGPWTLYHYNGTLHVYPQTSFFEYFAYWDGPGKLQINCNVTDGTVAFIDEVAVWDHELPRETIEATVRAYMPTSTFPSSSTELLPARSLNLSDGAEASVGLPVHIVETASAHLDLALQYAERAREGIYAGCSIGAQTTQLAHAQELLGTSLRYVLLAEETADSLVQGAGSAPSWYARYAAAKTALAGRKQAVVAAVRQLAQCENPLEVSEDDLPLYVGDAVGATDRFFAASHYLAKQARAYTNESDTALQAAAAAWDEQQQSEYQTQMGNSARNQRLLEIRQRYEGVLVRLCGPMADGSELLQQFFDGTLTAQNCYLKVELPQCRLSDKPIDSVPPECLRGELGEQIMALKAAKIDADNAQSNLERAIDAYDSQNQYCIRRQAFHTESAALLAAHLEHMKSLRNKRRWLGFARGIVSGITQAVVGVATGNPLAIGAAADHASAWGIVSDYFDSKWAEDMQQSEDAYHAMAEKRAADLDIMACFHEADNQKLAIDAAQDVIVKTFHQVRATQLHLENASAELTATIREASGEILTQQALGLIVPPQHHFWLDQRIRSFTRKFRIAKRMTYLALRALEYEAQQSVGLRDEVLTASRPDELDSVLAAIEARNMPFQGVAGSSIGTMSPVLSVRDDILRFEDLASYTSHAPGETPMSSVDALRAYLKSDSAKFYLNGEYRGRALRFFFRPQDWSATFCAERIWRLTASLQIEPSGAGTQINNPVVTLYEENSFGSQRCGRHRGLQVSRVQPTHNLFVEDADASSTYIEHPQYTAMNMTPLVNKSRTELESLSEGLHSGLAGRGPYSNYVLLFPKEQFDDATLARVKDILIRLDMVEVTNAD